MASRSLKLWATCLLASVASVSGSASSSAPPASITASPPNYGTNGSCSKNCGYMAVPYASAYWSQWITPVTVGTVLVIVDDSNDTTKTTTRYDTGEAVVGSATVPISDLIKSGLLSTESTTMTAETTGFDGSTTTVTYPTGWWTIAGDIEWAGTIPVTIDGTTSCSSWGAVITGSSAYFPFSLQASPLPSLARSTKAGTVDPQDPYGNLYKLQDYYEQEQLSKGDIASLFPDDPFLLEIYGCSSPTVPAAATAVQTVAALLATTTEHVTGANKGSKTPTQKPTPTVHTSHSQPTQPLPLTSDSPNPTNPPPETKSPPGVSQSPPDASPSSPAASCSRVGCYVNTQLGGHHTTATARTSATNLIIGTQTLVAGTTVVVYGTTFSMPTSETIIYINGETTAIPTTAFTVGPIGVTPTDAPPSSSQGPLLANGAERIVTSLCALGLSFLLAVAIMI